VCGLLCEVSGDCQTGRRTLLDTEVRGRLITRLRGKGEMLYRALCGLWSWVSSTERFEQRVLVSLAQAESPHRPLRREPGVPCENDTRSYRRCSITLQAPPIVCNTLPFVGVVTSPPPQSSHLVSKCCDRCVDGLKHIGLASIRFVYFILYNYAATSHI